VEEKAYIIKSVIDSPDDEKDARDEEHPRRLAKGDGIDYRP